jgi:hypothetical protein
MYRVTLHKCVSKAGNLQFLRHARKSDEDERPVAKPAVKKVAARAAPAATPSKRETEVEDLASYAPTSAATKSNAAPSTPWPYGALR